MADKKDFSDPYNKRSKSVFLSFWRIDNEGRPSFYCFPCFVLVDYFGCNSNKSGTCSPANRFKRSRCAPKRTGFAGKVFKFRRHPEPEREHDRVTRSQRLGRADRPGARAGL